VQMLGRMQIGPCDQPDFLLLRVPSSKVAVTVSNPSFNSGCIQPRIALSGWDGRAEALALQFLLKRLLRAGCNVEIASIDCTQRVHLQRRTANKYRCYAQASDEAQRFSENDPVGAGRFCFLAALLVDYDAKASHPPRALPENKIDSVTVCKCGRIRV
jgi:hypothetical protein